VREVRYRVIADELRQRVEDGEFAAGRLLPSEADLSRAYDASRVTVRKALELLRDEGLVASRQGFGWFVAVDPVRQALGRLGTFEQQLAELGVRSERRVLDFGFVAAPARVRDVFGARRVLAVRRLNLADGEPFARVTVWCPEALGSRFSRDDVERATFYELLDVPLGGATQTIGAAVAAEDDAEILGVPVGSPVLVCERVTCSADGEPVLMSEHVFPAHRTEFVVDLPQSEPSIAPSGLRLTSEPLLRMWDRSVTDPSRSSDRFTQQPARDNQRARGHAG
jgi:GntR family transcriptional regulator